MCLWGRLPSLYLVIVYRGHEKNSLPPHPVAATTPFFRATLQAHSSLLPVFRELTWLFPRKAGVVWTPWPSYMSPRLVLAAWELQL